MKFKINADKQNHLMNDEIKEFTIEFKDLINMYTYGAFTRNRSYEVDDIIAEQFLSDDVESDGKYWYTDDGQYFRSAIGMQYRVIEGLHRGSKMSKLLDQYDLKKQVVVIKYDATCNFKYYIDKNGDVQLRNAHQACKVSNIKVIDVIDKEDFLDNYNRYMNELF